MVGVQHVKLFVGWNSYKCSSYYMYYLVASPHLTYLQHTTYKCTVCHPYTNTASIVNGWTETKELKTPSKQCAQVALPVHWSFTSCEMYIPQFHHYYMYIICRNGSQVKVKVFVNLYCMTRGKVTRRLVVLYTRVILISFQLLLTWVTRCS